MSSDRIISKASLGAVKRWEFPDLAELQDTDAVMQAVDEQQQSQGGDAVRQQFVILRDLIAALSHPVQVLDDEEVNGIVALAMDVTRKLVRRGDATSAQPLLAAMQEILGVLPVGSNQ